MRRSQSFRKVATGVRQRRPRGFTLLELLVVLVIIGLLVGYVAPRYFSQVGKSEIKVTQAQINAFEKALDTYRLDVGRYPTTEEGLTVLVARPQNEPKWNGPYLQKAVPPDPWGKPYQYKSPGEQGREFDLWSFGKDGQPGGTGEAADITNW
jgi:general secretion pathway protein G